MHRRGNLPSGSVSWLVHARTTRTNALRFILALLAGLGGMRRAAGQVAADEPPADRDPVLARPADRCGSSARS